MNMVLSVYLLLPSHFKCKLHLWLIILNIECLFFAVIKGRCVHAMSSVELKGCYESQG